MRAQTESASQLEQRLQGRTVLALLHFSNKRSIQTGVQSQLLLRYAKFRSVLNYYLPELTVEPFIAGHRLNKTADDAYTQR